MLDSDLYFNRNSVPSLLWHFSTNSFLFHVVLSKIHLKTISTQFPEMLATGISWVAPTDAPTEQQKLFFIHTGGRLRQRGKQRPMTWSWLTNWSASQLQPHCKDFTEPDLPGDFKEVKHEQCGVTCIQRPGPKVLLAYRDLAPRCYLHTETWPQGVTCIQRPGPKVLLAYRDLAPRCYLHTETWPQGVTCMLSPGPKVLLAYRDLAPRCYLHAVTWPQGVTCIQRPGPKVLLAYGDLAPRCYLHTVTWPQGVTCMLSPGTVCK